MVKALVRYGSEQDVFYLTHIKRIGEHSMPGAHFHPCYEIYYLLAGERYYFINDKLYHIRKGDMVLIDKNVVHKTSGINLPDHERIMINFKDEFYCAACLPVNLDLLRPFQNVVQVIRFQADQQWVVESLLYKLAQEVTEQAVGFESYIRYVLGELLIYISRQLDTNAAVGTESNTPQHQKVNEIVKYINENYMNPLSLSTLSGQFFVSTYHISHVFRDVTGITFIDYVNIARIKAACSLLKGTDSKIIEIAEQVGFSNVVHFGRTFKKYMQETPLAYRKKNRS
ncbi:MAG: transcriptional regulator, AraC family [Bacilli bacterium]|nr:transcriptional regulator, AraC family [Bacilli bacterium]